MRGRAWLVGAATLATLFAASRPTAAQQPPLPPVRAVPRSAGEPSAPPPLPPSRPRDLDESSQGSSEPPPRRPTREVFGPPMPRRPVVVFGPPMPPRPTIAAPPSAVGSPAAAGPSDDELACVRLLSSRKVEARAASPPAPTAAGCWLPAPVEITAVLLPDGRRVPFQPAVTVACPFGSAFADWVRDDLAPVFEAAGTPLAGLVSTSGYACRGRNRVAGAKLSEHAKGDALDVGGFKTRTGDTISVKSSGAVLAAVKATACARFATVLGPGSDGFHEEHMHVDLEPRRHGSKICHWDMLPSPNAAVHAPPRDAPSGPALPNR